MTQFTYMILKLKQKEEWITIHSFPCKTLVLKNLTRKGDQTSIIHLILICSDKHYMRVCVGGGGSRDP